MANNIMFDRRVIRGNTYAAQILPAAVAPLGATAAGTGGSAHSKKRARTYRAPGTPEAAEGRRHIDVQTDTYLEELTDKAPEAEGATQTDAFMDRPPTPLFIPQKSGLDTSTQIEEGDLFDFDFEVEPLLEVLVGKTLEQGLMEVLEEEELAAMRAHQEHFEQIRNAELVATQRMEAAEQRKAEEKERRLAQERARVQREAEVREKIAAQTFARGYLNGLVGGVFERMYEDGFFYDPVERELEESFLPWLHARVGQECRKAEVAKAAIVAAAQHAIDQAAASRAAASAARLQAKKEAEAAAEAERQRLIAEQERIARDAEMPVALLAKLKESLGEEHAEAVTECEGEADAEYAPPEEGGEDDSGEGDDPPKPPPLPQASAKAKATVAKLVAKGVVDNAAVRAALAEMGEDDTPYAAEFADAADAADAAEATDAADAADAEQ